MATLSKKLDDRAEFSQFSETMRSEQKGREKIREGRGLLKAGAGGEPYMRVGGYKNCTKGGRM